MCFLKTTFLDNNRLLFLAQNGFLFFLHPRIQMLLTKKVESWDFKKNSSQESERKREPAIVQVLHTLNANVWTSCSSVVTMSNDGGNNEKDNFSS